MSMEETLSLIIHGCKLVRDLESNLPNLINQPNFLPDTCNEIIKVFTSAVHRLNSHHPPSYDPHMVFGEPPEARLPEIDAGPVVQEWLRSNYGLLQLQLSTDKNPFDDRALPKSMVGNTKPLELGSKIPVTTSGAKVLELGAANMDYVGDPKGSTLSKGGAGEFQAVERSDPGGKSWAQMPRRRKDRLEKRTERVAAPRIGNTEIPPDDGFTWRKYGQKEILGLRFPRCTHKSFYGCGAKKYVQRLDENPDVFEVTYFGDHTCHMSSTAPSLLLPWADIKPDIVVTTQPPLPTSLPPAYRWLSMEFGPTSGKDVNTVVDLHERMPRDFDLSGGGSRSRSRSRSSAAAGPSNVREGKEVLECPVVDLADAMFNSQSSSNSMDTIFPSMDDK
ncbi:hypothetical protein HHK36_018685 [Tetracentron sinense]|uniref:WRKY domain-containing protein n=1 Tax=Tetracentron sinense TaxID=13715 RepID=A0A834YZA3_TETSI|nr:hypothetical protein HHK36_018685 [Tetracentron sinense]